jgi:polygalacturonase
MAISCLVLAVILPLTFSVRLDDLGGIQSNSSIEAALHNAKIFKDAILVLNHSLVEIPSGQVYYMYPLLITGVDNLVVNLSGTIFAHDNYTYWELRWGAYGTLWEFDNCNNLTITGNGQGTIDGQGYNWWLQEFLVKLPYNRPHLILISASRDILVENIHLRNSPCFHLKVSEAANVVIRYITIKVDVWKQKQIFDSIPGGWLEGGIPLFPLNTDGIDPAGRNIHIHDVYVENYDDAVVIKPSNGASKNTNCSQDILVENIQVKYGVGMSIGSVPPHDHVNCVRNVTFRNVDFESPFKAIYIKTNPGTSGSGIIQDILYENMTIDFAVWWAIYIGPQQMKQPDGGGPGCMIYPLIPNCETQPLVKIDNIRLRNIQVKSTLLSPGIIRCNQSNPCTNLEFTNVQFHGLQSYLGFITEHAHGVVTNSFPVPKFESYSPKR